MKNKGKSATPVFDLDQASTAVEIPRRVVKAAHPKNEPIVMNVVSTSTTSTSTSTVVSNAVAAAVRDDDDNEIRAAETTCEQVPPTTRENVQKKIEPKKERKVMTAYEERQRLTRDKKLHDRRMASPQATTSATSKPKSHPNPFSKYLPSFSLYSQPKEHKRSVDPTKEDEEDTDAPKTPVEKRLRHSAGTEEEAYHYASTSNNRSSPSDTGSGGSSFWGSTNLAMAGATAAAAVATVAILVAVVVLRSKKAA